MLRELRQIATVVSLCSAVALFSACGGGGSDGGGGGGGGGSLGVYSGKTTTATITETSTKETLAGMSDIVPSCTATGVAKTATDAPLKTVMSAVKSVKLLLPPPPAKIAGKTVALISSTPPSTQTGSCGGTISYPTYSHLSGTTTVSVKLDNYCTVDSSSGNRTTMNGTVNAVDAGTPTATGPVTTSLTANIPLLTVVEKTAAGATVSSDTIAMSGFKYVPTAGATADIANIPGTMTLTSVEVKTVEGTTTKEFKANNVSVTTTKVGSNSQVSFTGTICRGTSGCSAVKTDTPLVTDSNQNFQSGAISFTGAGGSKATLTVVPGFGQIFNVSVNGTPLTGTQLHCDGL